MLLVACRDDDGKLSVRLPGRGPATTAFTPVDGTVVVVTADMVCSAEQRAAAAGSEAECKSEETAAVAAALSPEAVLVAGDIQYERGSRAQFAEGYSVGAWAPLKPITYPSPGNHEYSTQDAAPYFATFGAAAGPGRRGWYSVEIGKWHVVSLNSNCRPAGGCGPGSPQEQWLRADLAAARAGGRECALAFFHHPRWTSGAHGSDASIEGLWAALAEHDVELTLAGHDHHYERFAPERGVRQFVVGTGGRSLYPTFGTEAGSEIRNSNTFGVLELRLGADEYSWEFHGIPGTTFTDSGREKCH